MGAGKNAAPYTPFPARRNLPPHPALAEDANFDTKLFDCANLAIFAPPAIVSNCARKRAAGAKIYRGVCSASAAGQHAGITARSHCVG